MGPVLDRGMRLRPVERSLVEVRQRGVSHSSFLWGVGSRYGAADSTARLLPPPGGANCPGFPAGARSCVVGFASCVSCDVPLASGGYGEGKWRLEVSANRALNVLSLVMSRSGYLGSLLK